MAVVSVGMVGHLVVHHPVGHLVVRRAMAAGTVGHLVVRRLFGHLSVSKAPQRLFSQRSSLTTADMVILQIPIAAEKEIRSRYRLIR